MAKNFVELNIKELTNVRKELDRFQGNETMRLEFDKTAVANGKKVIAEAKKRTPVKTGNLKKHWDTDNSNMRPYKVGNEIRLDVWNRAEYAKNIEEGRIEARNVTFRPAKMLYGAEIVVREKPVGKEIIGKGLAKKLGGGKFDYN